MAERVVSGGRLTVDEVEELVRLAGAGVACRSIAARVRCALSMVYLLAGAARRAGGDGRLPRHLSLAGREEMRVGLAGGKSVRAIAGKLGRGASSVGREVAGNGGREAYRAYLAGECGWRASRCPRDLILLGNDRLRGVVGEKLELRWSPERIGGWLKVAFPHVVGMRVSRESIYRSLFVRGRGALRKGVHQLPARAPLRPQGSRPGGDARQVRQHDFHP